MINKSSVREGDGGIAYCILIRSMKNTKTL